MLFGGTFWESSILQLSSVKHKLPHKTRREKFWEQGNSVDDIVKQCEIQIHEGLFYFKHICMRS